MSVYGARHDERYAAVWVRRPGPDWSAVHGVDGAGYQGAFDRAAAAGFKPVLLSATGPADDPVFAGTFEQTTQGIPLTRFGLKSGDENDPWTIEHWIREARRNNWHPTAIAVYGAGTTSASPASGRRTRPTSRGPRPALPTIFPRINSVSTRSFLRADALSRWPSRPMAGMRRSSVTIRSVAWVARHGLTSAGYQQEFDRLVPQGFYPIDVHAGGQGPPPGLPHSSHGRDDRSARLACAKGPTTVAAIDTLVQQAMQRHRIRGAGLALVRAGRLVYAKGYTLAEAAYPSIQPTTFFRQASVSKTIVPWRVP